VNKNVEGGTLKVEGQSYTTGLGMNAQCTLVYDLPEGHHYKTFRALCGYDSSCDTDNPSATGTTMEFLVYVTRPQTFDFDLTQLGFAASESVPVYDVWERQSMAPAKGMISVSVPSHGVRLFRLGDNIPSSIGETAAVNRRSGADIWYNLQGMPVSHPSQGVYIRNGKKYVK
jgi:hypothetical protein